MPAQRMHQDKAVHVKIISLILFRLDQKPVPVTLGCRICGKTCCITFCSSTHSTDTQSGEQSITMIKKGANGSRPLIHLPL